MQDMPFFGHNSPRRHSGPACAGQLARLNAAFLTRIYPSNTRDQVARDTGASPDTVRRWLDQTQAPSARWIAQLAVAYGPAWVDAVILQLTTDTLERQKHEIEQSRAELDARQRILEAQLDRARHRRAAPVESESR